MPGLIEAAIRVVEVIEVGREDPWLGPTRHIGPTLWQALDNLCEEYHRLDPKVATDE